MRKRSQKEFLKNLEYGKEAEYKLLEYLKNKYSQSRFIGAEDYFKMMGLNYISDLDTTNGDIYEIDQFNRILYHYEVKRAKECSLPSITYYERKTDTFIEGNGAPGIYILFDSNMENSYCVPANKMTEVFKYKKDKEILNHVEYDDLIKPIDEGLEIIRSNKEWKIEPKIIKVEPGEDIKELYTQTPGYYACISKTYLSNKKIKWFVLHFYNDEKSPIYVYRDDLKKVKATGTNGSYWKSKELLSIARDKID